MAIKSSARIMRLIILVCNIIVKLVKKKIFFLKFNYITLNVKEKYSWKKNKCLISDLPNTSISLGNKK